MAQYRGFERFCNKKTKITRTLVFCVLGLFSGAFGVSFFVPRQRGGFLPQSRAQQIPHVVPVEVQEHLMYVLTSDDPYRVIPTGAGGE